MCQLDKSSHLYFMKCHKNDEEMVITQKYRGITIVSLKLNTIWMIEKQKIISTPNYNLTTYSDSISM